MRRLSLKLLSPLFILWGALLMPAGAYSEARVLRIATFNVSMEGGNYVGKGVTPSGHELPGALSNSEHPQIKNIAEIIQRIRPDLLLLNEFDYHADPEQGVKPFIERYLQQSRADVEAIDYPYYYQGPVNTGVDSGMDLDRDGDASGTGNDAFGYGLYPGQYGMLLLSRYPIDFESIRSFQLFKWKDMPDNLMRDMRTEDKELWYPESVQKALRLSSKSHWDVPIRINGQVLHVLASHPTPPVFDGPEDRNGRRNHDEIRFWVDYIEGGEQAAYIYDDRDQPGGLNNDRFVILGDLNASMEEGDARREGITALLGHDKVRRGLLPTSDGGRANNADSRFSPTHTASWGMRADYVIPSKEGWRVIDAGVFWPAPDDPLRRLVKNRRASSDHRLVWMDLELVD
ncbi:endonuclease/exonuclease/phosphatase family protein [Congregibacter sp.]|uniref:endonuclease/exonuclease/phosphatase family protein n=1 Tax=Congregibacter sp. TaxID=2744308 RepID=UPI003F6D89EB